MKCPSGSSVDTIYGEHPHVYPHIQASKHNNNIVISCVIFLFRIFPSRRRACGGGASATRGPDKDDPGQHVQRTAAGLMGTDVKIKRRRRRRRRSG